MRRWYNPLTWFRSNTPTVSAPISSPALAQILAPRNPTAAGVYVNPQSALNCSPWWSGIRLISESVALMPAGVEAKTEHGRVEVHDHPAAVLLGKPSPAITRFTFFQTLMNHVLSRGNGYAEIIFQVGTNRPVELCLLDPDDIAVYWRQEGNGYRKTYVSMKSRHSWDQSEIFHIPGLGYDGLAGYPVWEFARQSIALDLAAETYGARWFGDGGRPAGVLKYPGKLTEEEADRIRASWAARHSPGSHTPALLQEGMDFSAFENDPSKAQSVEIRKMQVAVVARFLRIPPHLLYEMDGSPTVSGLDQMSREFLMFTLSPWLTLLEEEAQDKLLLPSEQRKVFVAIDESALLRVDGLSRAQMDQMDLNAGICTRAEIRSRRGLPFIPGTDTLQVPLNYGILRPDGTVDNNGIDNPNGNGISNKDA